MASAIYELKREQPISVTVWVVHIHLEDFYEIEGADFYYATTKGVEIFLNGETVKPVHRLKDFPKGRHQKDRANDYAEFALTNESNATYQDFRPFEQIIEKGEVTIYQLLEIERDYYEAETRFIGNLKDFTVSERDKTLNFTAHSDMSRTGFRVAARILTRERCGTIFNFGGLNAPEYHACGWQLAQGGNPDNCTYLLEGEDGCIAHGNAHRFYAVPALSTAEITFVPDDQVDFPFYPGSSCFTENVFVVLPDWTIKSIKDVNKREVILGFDIFNNNKVIPTEVMDKFVHPNSEYIFAKFDKGTLETTEQHLFCIGGATFAPVGSLEYKGVSGLGENRKRAQTALLRKGKPSGKTTTYNLHTDCFTYIVTNADMSFFWFVHNLKDTVGASIQY